MPRPMTDTAVRKTRTKTSGLSICHRCSWTISPLSVPVKADRLSVASPKGQSRLAQAYESSGCNNGSAKCSHRWTPQCDNDGSRKTCCCEELLAKHSQTSPEDEQDAGQNNKDAAATAAWPGPILSSGAHPSGSPSEETAATQAATGAHVHSPLIRYCRFLCLLGKPMV
jgi:hypothetical protein